MTNIEKWRFFTKGLPSPDAWIDFGFYWLIGACLQRRVWLYDNIMPLYPNQYVVFVGPPGIGKGIILGPLAQIMKFWKYEKGQLIKTSIGQELPPLYPVGADSITFEQLLADVGDSSRRIPTPDNKVYMHCSYAFILEELASLFKHKTSDVIKFLQNAYDSKEYEYRTKHQGKDMLRNICFSFIAGTQPDFLKEASESRIFGQGFASRALFLFETQERFSTFHIAQFEPEQLSARHDIIAWIKQLSTLYGQVTYDNEAFKFLEKWNTEVFDKQRAKAPYQMLDYFARKKVMLLKLAIAIHFGESLRMVLTIDSLRTAIKMLDAVETKMAAGFGLSGANELHSHAMRILAFIKKSETPVRKREVILAFGANLEISEIDTCMEELALCYGIKRRTNDGSYYI